MELLATLNAPQRLAATHGNGPLLVLAGAGTGKTLTLASRLAHLVLQGADPQRVLLMTFSRRAAAQMARRAGQLLHQSLGMPSSTAPPTLPWCGTFHSIAARLLREEAPRVGLNPGFTILDRSDAQDLMAHTRQALGLAGQEHRLPLAPTCLAIHSRCINTRQPVAQVIKTSFPWCMGFEADLARLFEGFGQAKLQQHSLDYDDLLLAWWHLMQAPNLGPRIGGHFDHLLVDEVQDINRLQADILLALKPTGQGLTAVGDDAQSIYAFRGADVQHILAFPARFTPAVAVVTLTQNYRSTPDILQTFNGVIACAEERFPKDLWTDRPAACRPSVHVVEDEAAQARGVADTVLALRETGLALKRQAVLFRTGTHSAPLELELTRRGIPFVKYGGLKFMEAAHVKVVLSVLRWADNPHARLPAMRTAGLVPGMGPASVRRLLEHTGPLAAFKPPAAAATPWQALLKLVLELRDTPDWPDELGRVLAWYQPHLERLHEDARVRLADLEQLRQVAASHASRKRLVTELTLEPPEASSDEAGVPHRDEDYLILSTLHSAKGQEWNAVHILKVVDGCMPADMATGSSADIEEERRLLYVGMTRARDALSLWMPQRFHITQQRVLGGRHLYALRSRFITTALLGHFDQVGATTQEAPALPTASAVPAINLMEVLRGHWVGPATPASNSAPESQTG